MQEQCTHYVKGDGQQVGSSSLSHSLTLTPALSLFTFASGAAHARTVHRLCERRWTAGRVSFGCAAGWRTQAQSRREAEKWHVKLLRGHEKRWKAERERKRERERERKKERQRDRKAERQRQTDRPTLKLSSLSAAMMEGVCTRNDRNSSSDNLMVPQHSPSERHTKRTRRC
jgi:PAS domain-containing protein